MTLTLLTPTGSDGATTGAGDDGVDDLGPDGAVLVSEKEAFEQDARAYADLHDLELDEARVRLADERAFAEQVSDIVEDHPHTFAMSKIEHGQEFTGTIAFTRGHVAPDVASDIRTERMKVVVEADAQLSERALLQRLDKVQQALDQAGYPDIVGVPNPEDGTVHFEVEVPRDQRGRSQASMLAELPDHARAPDVSVNFHEQSLGEPEDVYGGALTPNSNTNAKCTTGFTVKKDGVSGFLTAGHCTNDRDVWDHQAGVRVNAPFKSQHRGAWGDFQWHTSGRNEGPYFYARKTEIRKHKARRTASLGETLCVFGRVSLRQCHEVYKIGISAKFDNITHKKLVAMHRHVTAGGDSGGPWYAGSYGYGVHTGYKKIWGIKRSIFAQARYMDEALGVLPKTTS